MERVILSKPQKHERKHTMEKKHTTILEATGRFIQLRQTCYSADLVALWTPGHETQINPSPEGGEPVEGKRGYYTNGTDEWGPIRIPKGSATNPHFRDYPAPWVLDEHADAIGMSGWDYQEKRSDWIGFEFDDIIKHLGTGVAKEKIEEIKAALWKLDYVMVRRGTSGIESDGIHCYVFLNGIPTANHNEHAAIARAIVAKIAADTGLDIQASIDQCGRILWCWAKRAREEKRSYECLQASTIVLTEADLPNWQEYIKIKKTGDALDATAAYQTIEPTADHKRFDEEYDKRGWPRDGEYLHKAGIKETCEALGFARFPTTSPGTDKTRVNCVVYRTHRGLRVVSLGEEGPEWVETENGNPRIDYTFIARPIIRITADLYRVVEQSIQALRTDSNTYQNGALSEIIHDAEKPPLCVADNGDTATPSYFSTHPHLQTFGNRAKYEKFDKRAGKWVPSLPTDPVVSAVIKSAHYPGIRVITNVVSCPMLLPMAPIAREPGYDRATGLFLDIQGDYPDLMDGDVAVQKLSDVVVDFPFVTDNHRSAWIALAVTMVSRAAFSGCCPFFLFRANMSGTGKTLLMDATTTISEDREAAKYAFPKDQDEFRKAVTAAALAGVPYLALDNIKGRVGGGVFENALTSTALG